MPVEVIREYPRKVTRPRYLSAFIDGVNFTTEECDKFVARWRDLSLPVEDLGGGVFDISSEYLTDIEENLTKLKMGKKFNDKFQVIIEAIRSTSVW